MKTDDQLNTSLTKAGFRSISEWVPYPWENGREGWRIATAIWGNSEIAMVCVLMYLPDTDSVPHDAIIVFDSLAKSLKVE